MFGTHDIALFIAAGLLLNITPGADFLFILGRSAAGGFAAGVRAALGVGAGCFVHMAAAALGLSALLVASATAFIAVKWIGAAYLVYLGVTLMRKRGGLAWSASALARRLDVTARVGRWLNRCLGALFLALGAKLAFSRLD